MSIPLQRDVVVFNAITETTTKELTSFGNETTKAVSVIIEVVAASTPSWTLDIQGKIHPLGTYTNVDYIKIWEAGLATFSKAQLSITNTTRRFYLIPNAPPYLQFVATRTAGNLTIYASYTTKAMTAVGRFPIEEYMIQQTRLDQDKNTHAGISKTTTAQETIVSWVVSNLKNGYLTGLYASVNSHVSETRHDIQLVVDTTVVMEWRFGQGVREFGPYAFNPPYKIVGNATKFFRLRVSQNTVNQSDYFATLRGWEEE